MQYIDQRFWVYPSQTPIFERFRTFAVDAASGLLAATTQTANACDRVRSQLFFYAPHHTRWNTFAPPANGLGQVVRVAMALQTAASVGGVALRLIDEYSHYRLEVSTASATLLRMLSNVRTPLGTFPLPRSHAVGEWFSVGLRSKVDAFELLYGPAGNETVFASARDSGYYNQWGTAGVMITANSSALYDNFTIDVECDAGGVARSIYADTSIAFSCKTGYKTVGNTTMRCGGSGVYTTGPLICLSDPPTPLAAPLTVLERSANGTYVGLAVAIPANGEQVLSYAITAQYPPPPAAGAPFAFSISGCSGTVRVLDPSQISYAAAPNMTLTVAAWPDSQRIAAVLYNVTVQLTRLPSPPTLQDQTVFVAEGGCGPAWANFSLDITNPDALPLTVRIDAGNREGQFLLNATSGALGVACSPRRCPAGIPPAQCAPGVHWAYRSDYALSVTAVLSSAIDTSAGSSGAVSTSTATLSVVVVDVNSPPYVAGGSIAFEAFEQDASPGSFIGFVAGSDEDALNIANEASPDTAARFSLSYAPLANAPVQVLTRNGTVSVAGAALNVSRDGLLAFGSGVDDVLAAAEPAGGYFFYNRRLVRAVLTGRFVVADGGGLSSAADVVVSLLAANETGNTPTITDITFVSGSGGGGSGLGSGSGTVGLSTAGGDVMLFAGSSFPARAPMDVRFRTPDGTLRVASSCVIATSTQASCRAPEGFGFSLPLTVTMAGRAPNATVPLEATYSPPRVTAVEVTEASALSTSGSSAGSFVIRGANFGPAWGASFLSIRIGDSFAAAPVSVSHSSINATLGAGCGSSLAVIVAVAGQDSTAAWLDSVSSLLGMPPTVVGYDELGRPVTDTVVPSVAFSYPRAALTGFQLAAGSGSSSTYSSASLSTRGGQSFRLLGRNFGPALVRGAPRAAAVTYADASGIFRYTITCSPGAGAAAHSTLDCISAPGVGKGHVFTVDVCGQASPPAPFSVSYAAPVLTDISGSGAKTASTEGGQRIILRGRNFGPLSRLSDAVQPVTAVRYGRMEPDQPQYQAVDCFVATTNDDDIDSDIYCLTAPGTGDNLGALCLQVSFTSGNATQGAVYISSQSALYYILSVCFPCRTCSVPRLHRLPAVQCSARQARLLWRPDRLILHRPRRCGRRHARRPRVRCPHLRPQLRRRCVAGGDRVFDSPQDPTRKRRHCALHTWVSTRRGAVFTAVVLAAGAASPARMRHAARCGRKLRVDGRRGPPAVG